MPGEEPLITDYIIGFIFSPAGLVLGFLIVAVLGFLFILKRLGGFKAFKAVPLDSILRQQYNSIISVTGISGKWGSLRREDKIIAKILKVGVLHFTTPNPEYKKPKKKKEADEIITTDSKQKFLEKEMFIFKLSFNPDFPVIRQILDFISTPKYAIVEAENVYRIDIDKNNNVISYYNINPKAQVFSFANIFLYGFYPLQLTQDLAWIYGREKEKEELVNYPKRVVFLETQHSKSIDTLAEITELEKKKYESRLGSLGA